MPPVLFNNGSVNESGLLKVHLLLKIAPNLAESQHVQIRDMVISNCHTAEIADAVGRSERSVFEIKSNLHSLL
jgi:hypothetical protein